MKHLPFLVAIFLTVVSAFATSEQQAEAILKNMITAQIADNYAGFLADADADLKAALTKGQFDSVNAQLNPLLKSGYEIKFLGELRQQGFQVFLFRLRFKTGADDTLATLSLKNDKVGGIYYH